MLGTPCVLTLHVAAAGWTWASLLTILAVCATDAGLGECAVLQTMDPEDEDKFDFDPLDVTKIWPEHLFPLQPVGRMVLNKNPDNFFTENEQLAFCPAACRARCAEPACPCIACL